MVARKLKVEVRDEEGYKMTITLQGTITRNKMLQLLDLVELLGEAPSTDPVETAGADLSKFEKMQLVLNRKFPMGWFTTQEVFTVYEDICNEPIGLSTVSTYLTRLTDLGFLSRAGSRVRYRYKLTKKRRIREEQKIYS